MTEGLRVGRSHLCWSVAPGGPRPLPSGPEASMPHSWCISKPAELGLSCLPLLSPLETEALANVPTPESTQPCPPLQKSSPSRTPYTQPANPRPASLSRPISQGPGGIKPVGDAGWMGTNFRARRDAGPGHPPRTWAVRACDRPGMLPRGWLKADPGRGVILEGMVPERLTAFSLPS